ncbi:MAG TPA: putative peptidoglycan-binding domain-containing protein, partial [Sphingomonas sp.]|nr:putative peptidoglycan-binding domain-containing protein [Sphingomonas sp.]
QRPGFDRVAERAPVLAAEMFDTGVNMGPAVAAAFLQRALNALNRGARDYPDIATDGRMGALTLAALDAFLTLRGAAGEAVLLKAIEALQGERYLHLAERRPANEAFLYGWLANRIGETE